MKAFIRVDGKPGSDYDSKPLSNSINLKNKTIDSIVHGNTIGWGLFGDKQDEYWKNLRMSFPVLVNTMFAWLLIMNA